MINLRKLAPLDDWRQSPGLADSQSNQDTVWDLVCPLQSGWDNCSEGRHQKFLRASLITQDILVYNWDSCFWLYFPLVSQDQKKMAGFDVSPFVYSRISKLCKLLTSSVCRLWIYEFLNQIDSVFLNPIENRVSRKCLLCLAHRSGSDHFCARWQVAELPHQQSQIKYPELKKTRRKLWDKTHGAQHLAIFYGPASQAGWQINDVMPSENET